MRRLGIILALALAPGFAQATGVFYDALEAADVSGGGTVGAGSSLCFSDPLAAQSMCIDSSDAGKLRFAGSGGANDEDLILDVETTADTVALSSGTGVTSVTLSGMGVTAETFVSDSADPADSGVVRLANSDAICWEQSPAASDGCLSYGATEVFAFSAPISSSTHTVSAGAAYLFSGRSEITSPADGSVLLTNDAGTDFDYLQFGGTTSSFPALKRDTTSLVTRLADDSADAPHVAASFEATTGDISVAATNYIRFDGPSGTTLVSENSTDNINVSIDSTSVLDIGNGSGTNATIIARRGTIRSQLSNGTATLELERSDGTPNPGDVVGELKYFAYNTTPTADIQYAGLIGYIEDATPTDEDGSAILRVRNDGALASALNCDMTDGTEDCTFGFDHEQYGEMYIDSDQTITISVATTDYTVADFSAGALNGWVFTAGTDELDPDAAGTYRLAASISSRGAGAGSFVLRYTIAVNGTPNSKCRSRRTIGAAGTDTGSQSINCILALSAGDTIELLVQNETSTTDVIVSEANVSLTQL